MVLLPDRVQSRVVVWRRSASHGHCERLAAPVGGRATVRLPPEPDPTANAQVWSNRGSPRTPADHSSPERRGEEERTPEKNRENRERGSVKKHESLKTVKE